MTPHSLPRGQWAAPGAAPSDGPGGSADALDILGVVSLIHRKLDGTRRPWSFRDAGKR